jgi:hypothetical protein
MKKIKLSEAEREVVKRPSDSRLSPVFKCYDEAFKPDFILTKLSEYEVLRDKVSYADDCITITFHKYLHISFSDDYCEFFGRHIHPADDNEILEFVKELLDEKYVFFHRHRFPQIRRIYGRSKLPRLLQSKNKKGRRLYSATKIYIDN